MTLIAIDSSSRLFSTPRITAISARRARVLRQSGVYRVRPAINADDGSRASPRQLPASRNSLKLRSMDRTLEASVVVVGGGPVGLTHALDLAWRGIDVTVLETRHAGEPPNVKCNQVSARSMEVFRRIGLADKIRATGLPAEYRNDVSCCVSATGAELSRIKLPSRAGRMRGEKGDDGWWPTAEFPHRINQLFLEPLLFAHAAAQPRIRILNRTRFDGFAQDAHGVTATAEDLDSGERLTLTSRYLVGCDGGRSTVRHGIGAELAGIPVVQHVQSTYFRAPDLIERLPGEPAWMYLAFNPRRCGTMMAIDGRERWLIHNFLYHGETDYESVDRDWAIRNILGVGDDFAYEVISKEDWIGRRLVADRFGKGRAFICGDAAHLWIPHAGYGMNAGIADAADLAWMLAAVLDGWAEPRLLEAYSAERQPITDQVSHFAFKMSKEVSHQRREISADIERDDDVGEGTRARLGQEAYDLYVQQQCCGGLNFGYFYAGSPVIAYDDEPHPTYSMGRFASSSVPGCRAPHVWLGEGRSLYDAAGAGFGLLRFDRSIPVDAIVDAAQRRRVPLAVVDIADEPAQALYARKLALIRPDHHVAWRGDAAPADPLGLIDLVRGARPNS
jgi:2-polyprenyl-6-methoxyphenol hydroxylase-like FAD-dependent oxidoreductase